MLFQPGQSGNPSGRKRGVRGGRTFALMTLDRMLARASNQQALGVALEREFLTDPVGFFRLVIMPLLPRETRTATEAVGVVGWRTLVSASVTGAGLISDSGIAEALPGMATRQICGEAEKDVPA